MHFSYYTIKVIIIIIIVQHRLDWNAEFSNLIQADLVLQKRFMNFVLKPLLIAVYLKYVYKLFI